MENESFYGDLANESHFVLLLKQMKTLADLLEAHIDSTDKDVNELSNKLTDMKLMQQDISNSISELFLVTQRDVCKNKRIADVEAELDDYVFRRNNRFNDRHVSDYDGYRNMRDTNFQDRRFQRNRSDPTPPRKLDKYNRSPAPNRHRSDERRHSETRNSDERRHSETRNRSRERRNPSRDGRRSKSRNRSRGRRRSASGNRSRERRRSGSGNGSRERRRSGSGNRSRERRRSESGNRSRERRRSRSGNRSRERGRLGSGNRCRERMRSRSENRESGNRCDGRKRSKSRNPSIDERHDAREILNEIKLKNYASSDSVVCANDGVIDCGDWNVNEANRRYDEERSKLKTEDAFDEIPFDVSKYISNQRVLSQNFNSRGGQKVNSRGGQNFNSRGGQNVNSRSGQNVNSRGGQNVNSRSGQNVNLREAQNFNSRRDNWGNRLTRGRINRGPNLNSARSCSGGNAADNASARKEELNDAKDDLGRGNEGEEAKRRLTTNDFLSKETGKFAEYLDKVNDGLKAKPALDEDESLEAVRREKSLRSFKGSCKINELEIDKSGHSKETSKSVEGKIETSVLDKTVTQLSKPSENSAESSLKPLEGSYKIKGSSKSETKTANPFSNEVLKPQKDLGEFTVKPLEGCHKKIKPETKLASTETNNSKPSKYEASKSFKNHPESTLKPLEGSYSKSKPVTKPVLIEIDLSESSEETLISSEESALKFLEDLRKQTTKTSQPETNFVLTEGDRSKPSKEEMSKCSKVSGLKLLEDSYKKTKKFETKLATTDIDKSEEDLKSASKLLEGAHKRTRSSSKPENKLEPPKDTTESGIKSPKRSLKSTRDNLKSINDTDGAEASKSASKLLEDDDKNSGKSNKSRIKPAAIADRSESAKQDAIASKDSGASAKLKPKKVSINTPRLTAGRGKRLVTATVSVELEPKGFAENVAETKRANRTPKSAEAMRCSKEERTNLGEVSVTNKQASEGTRAEFVMRESPEGDASEKAKSKQAVEGDTEVPQTKTKVGVRGRKPSKNSAEISKQKASKQPEVKKKKVPFITLETKVKRSEINKFDSKADVVTKNETTITNKLVTIFGSPTNEVASVAPYIFNESGLPNDSLLGVDMTKTTQDKLALLGLDLHEGHIPELSVKSCDLNSCSPLNKNVHRENESKPNSVIDFRIFKSMEADSHELKTVTALNSSSNTLETQSVKDVPKLDSPQIKRMKFEASDPVQKVMETSTNLSDFSFDLNESVKEFVSSDYPNLSAAVESNLSAPINPNSSAPINANLSSVINPNSSAPINPNSSSAINPNSSAPINPNSSSVINPNSSALINPNLSAPINPNLSSAINPNLSAPISANLSSSPINANLSSAPINANLSSAINPNSSAPINPNLSAPINLNLSTATDQNLSVAHNLNLSGDLNLSAETDPNLSAVTDSNLSKVIDPNSSKATDPNLSGATDPNLSRASNLNKSDSVQLTLSAQNTSVSNISPRPTTRKRKRCVISFIN